MRLNARRVARPDGTLRPGAVCFDGPLIAAVEDLAPGERAPDRTLAPGLIDVQVNGHADLDVTTGDTAGLAELGRTLARLGTTSWCPTLTSLPLPVYRSWLDSHPHPAPGEIGLHLEGPFITRVGAHRPDALRPLDDEWLSCLPARVAMVTLAPELPGAIRAIETLVARGVVVALGHSGATYSQATAAAGAGALLVTHVFNAMAPLHHREPGLAGAALADDRLTPTVIADGVHVHPAVLRLVLATGPAIMVSDSVAWRLLPGKPGPAGDPGRPDAGRLPGGDLAGSVVSLGEAVRYAVLDAGVDLAVALAAVTGIPAAVLGTPDRGRLAPGARADVVVLGPGLEVTEVWVGGETTA